MRKESKNISNSKKLLEIALSDENYIEVKAKTKELANLVDEEVENLSSSDELISNLINQYGDVKSIKEKYEFLTKITKYHSKLGGLIWAYFYSKLQKSEEVDFLGFCLKEDARYIWDMQRSFETFLMKSKIDSAVLAKWLKNVIERVGGDMMSGVFLTSIKKWGMENPKLASSLVKKIRNGDYASEGLERLLGSLLVSSLREIGAGNSLDLDLEISNNEFDLFLYLDSWRIYVSNKEIQLKKVKSLTNKYKVNLTEFSQNTLVSFLLNIAFSDFHNESVQIFAWDTLEEIAQSGLPAVAKCNILSYMWKQMDKNEDKAEIIIKRLFPISAKNLSVWKELEHYLVGKIKDKEDCFSIFLEIVDKDQGTLCKLIQNHTFEYLLQQLQNNAEVLETLLSKLLLNKTRGSICLLFCLLEKTNINLSIDGKVSEDLLFHLLENFQAEWIHIEGRSTSKLLLFLNEKAEELGKDLTNDFDLSLGREMYQQAINYGSDCFQQWKTIKKPSKRLKMVIKEAEKYFSNLEKAKKCSANSFYYPSFERFYMLHQEKFQHDVLSGASKSSFAMMFCKNFDLIYGELFSTVSKDGLFQVSEPTSLNSSQFEGTNLPRLQFANPETCAVKKLSAKKKLDA